MMTNVRMLFLALLSMLAVGAALSSSASAYEYDVGGEALTEATNIEGTSGLSLIAGTIGGAEVKIDCTQDTLTGKIELAGSGTNTLLLKKCTETNPVGCSVPETIEGKLKDKLIGPGAPLELFEAASGGTIALIVVSGGSCAGAGTYQLQGTQNCELPQAEAELAEHEVVCKKVGSHLKFAGNAATLSTTEKVKLKSGAKWNVAAATGVCNTAPAGAGCNAGTYYAENEVFKGKNLGNFKIEDVEGRKIECTESGYAVKLGANPNAAGAVAIKITELTFGSCILNGVTPCTLTSPAAGDVALPWNGAIRWTLGGTTGPNGSFTSRTVSIKAECGAEKCNYIGAGIESGITGKFFNANDTNKPAVSTRSEIQFKTVKMSGALECGGTVEMSSIYSVIPTEEAKNVFIANG
jgi:hypothetical protein